jgi:hypothetical protein
MKRKMKIHREGYKTLLVCGIVLLTLTALVAYYFKNITLYYIVGAFSLVIFLLSPLFSEFHFAIL